MIGCLSAVSSEWRHRCILEAVGEQLSRRRSPNGGTECCGTDWLSTGFSFTGWQRKRAAASASIRGRRISLANGAMFAVQETLDDQRAYIGGSRMGRRLGVVLDRIDKPILSGQQQHRRLAAAGMALGTCFARVLSRLCRKQFRAQQLRQMRSAEELRSSSTSANFELQLHGNSGSAPGGDSPYLRPSYSTLGANSTSLGTERLARRGGAGIMNPPFHTLTVS